MRCSPPLFASAQPCSSFHGQKIQRACISDPVMGSNWSAPRSFCQILPSEFPSSASYLKELQLRAGIKIGKKKTDIWTMPRDQTLWIWWLLHCLLLPWQRWKHWYVGLCGCRLASKRLASCFGINMLEFGDEFVCAESFGTGESKVLKLLILQHYMKQEVLPPRSGPQQYWTAWKGASGIGLKKSDAWWASLACLLPTEIRPRTDDTCSKRTGQRALCSVHSWCASCYLSSMSIHSVL